MTDIEQKALALVNEVRGEKFVCLSEAVRADVVAEICEWLRDYDPDTAEHITQRFGGRDG